MRGAAAAGRPVQVGRAAGAPTVVYLALERRWSLWRPCDRCGGTALPLRERADVNASGRLRPPFNEICGQLCPGCETHRKRLEPAPTEPTVWYDTLLGDWVVQLACRGLRGGALLPLEIRWFDAPWADVYRAAGDIAYGSDALRFLMSDELPQARRSRGSDNPA
jgi:hypothetical protein